MTNEMKAKKTTLLDFAKIIDDDATVVDEATGERFAVAAVKDEDEDDARIMALAKVYANVEAGENGTFRLSEFLESREDALDAAFGAVGRTRRPGERAYDVARFHLVTMGWDATDAEATKFAAALA